MLWKTPLGYGILKFCSPHGYWNFSVFLIWSKYMATTISNRAIDLQIRIARMAALKNIQSHTLLLGLSSCPIMQILQIKSLHLIWKSGTQKFHQWVPYLEMSFRDLTKTRGYQCCLSSNGPHMSDALLQIQKWCMSPWWTLQGWLTWQPMIWSSHCKSFEDQVHSIYGFPISKWVAVTWQGWVCASIVVTIMAMRWHTPLISTVKPLI